MGSREGRALVFAIDRQRKTTVGGWEILLRHLGSLSRKTLDSVRASCPISCEIGYVTFYEKRPPAFAGGLFDFDQNPQILVLEGFANLLGFFFRLDDDAWSNHHHQVGCRTANTNVLEQSVDIRNVT